MSKTPLFDTNYSSFQSADINSLQTVTKGVSSSKSQNRIHRLACETFIDRSFQKPRSYISSAADIDALEQAISAKANAHIEGVGATAGIDEEIEKGMNAEVFLDNIMKTSIATIRSSSPNGKPPATSAPETRNRCRRKRRLSEKS